VPPAVFLGEDRGREKEFPPNLASVVPALQTSPIITSVSATLRTRRSLPSSTFQIIRALRLLSHSFWTDRAGVVDVLRQR
jgi:hypothetical protein